MKPIVVQDDVALVAVVNNWLQNALLSSSLKTVQLPAGSTPISLYKSWTSQPPDFLKEILNEVIFQQVDDVLTGPKAGLFKTFFERHLPTYTQRFQPLSNAPLTPDIAILGVGVNGHLAFHEPEVNFNFNYGCVKLSPVTCESLSLSSPTWGISYGAGHFLNCPSLLIIAKGKNKKTIVTKALTEEIPTSPFSYILKTHPNCCLVIDEGTF